jgi:tRNA threonylcarbamoyladenosine biosynthesis protein TsaE
MKEHFEFSFFSRNSSRTIELGKLLGAHLSAGCVIGLVGELGAGKTCFIKGIAEGLNNTPESEVTSPTFTILQEYPGPVPLYHFDAYRLSGSHDLEAIGFEDYVGADGVAVIEWADRIQDALPDEALLITIEVVSDNERRFVCLARGTHHGDILAAFRAALAAAG